MHMNVLRNVSNDEMVNAAAMLVRGSGLADSLVLECGVCSG